MTDLARSVAARIGTDLIDYARAYVRACADNDRDVVARADELVTRGYRIVEWSWASGHVIVTDTRTGERLARVRNAMRALDAVWQPDWYAVDRLGADVPVRYPDVPETLAGLIDDLDFDERELSDWLNRMGLAGDLP